MIYLIEVSECINSQFEIEAPTSHEAMKIIAKKYYDEELTVESGINPDITFRVIRSWAGAYAPLVGNVGMINGIL